MNFGLPPPTEMINYIPDLKYNIQENKTSVLCGYYSS